MYIFLIILNLLFNTPFNHDIQVAFFKIYQETEELKMDVKFEAEDILSYFSIQQKDMDSEILTDYLHKHLQIKINYEAALLKIADYDFKEKHLHIKVSLGKFRKVITNIDIINTCLISIEDHSNIIECRINQKERDFLMNNERQAIQIEY